MDYIELTLDAADAEQAEILTAELADFPFESFEQEGARLKAYIPQERLADCKGEVDALLAHYGVGRATFLSIEPQNWNALWESNFTPVEVDGRLTIRAPFHAPAATEAEVVIMPKMSFGTGHHATTCLMASGLLDRDVTGLRGLDMGSGTGVLAIVAALRGAEAVDAVDIDEWAYNNALENIRLNHTEDIQVALGGAEQIARFGQFDFVFANINRNILLNDICQYVHCMKPGASLFMSGFYQEDIPVIQAECEKNGLRFDSFWEKDNWVAVKVSKPE